LFHAQTLGIRAIGTRVHFACPSQRKKAEKANAEPLDGPLGHCKIHKSSAGGWMLQFNIISKTHQAFGMPG
jgi:hypothetical protein